MRTLHELPRFRDRWSYLYLEYGTLDQARQGLVFENKSARTSIPINQLNLILLGPGTTVTHAAVKALAGNSCLLAWTGQEGVKFYAHSTGATFSARRLIRQARLASDEQQRLQVVYRMYQKRFPGEDILGRSLEQVRGLEGQRVRAAYAEAAERFGVNWEGRNYDQDNWGAANPANRALSAANSCLYGVCHAAIVAAGYSAGLGFIHTGKMLSFVYDIADLYKTELTVPVAFRLAGQEPAYLEREVRIACRQAFHEFGLMERILPDIAEVLDAGDDLGEIPGDFEGRAVTLADADQAGGVPGQPDAAGEGRTVAEGAEETEGGRARDPDMDGPE
jgi:CRISPR-associated protein Cas1